MIAGCASVLLGVAAVLPRFSADEPFPHEAHAGLFPACVACHAGVETGDRGRVFPPRATCAGCHDGTREERVAYTPPAPGGPSLLTFDHVAHAVHDEAPAACEGCHTEFGAERMAVRHAVAGRCLDCHAHAAPAHVVAADCSSCHATFAASGLEPERALALTVPEAHRTADFIARVHADSANARPQRCATCHVRERCLACHVDATQPVVAGMPSLDGRAVALPARAAAYPEPASHRDPGWIAAHGADARARPTDCSTCHTRQTCTTCHRGTTPTVLAALPDSRRGVAPGVTTERAAPRHHETPDFRRAHGTLATTAAGSCTTCHVRTECEACHSAPDRAPFHMANFEVRHAAAAYARETECASCHNAERFCRDCHAQAGLRAEGRLGSGFHDAEPLWLLRHGQPARQTLESCTSCHVQRDCMQCHSQGGSFRVSPHGPGFDAERAYDRNARVCSACHFGDPLGGGA